MHLSEGLIAFPHGFFSRFCNSRTERRAFTVVDRFFIFRMAIIVDDGLQPSDTASQSFYPRRDDST